MKELAYKLLALFLALLAPLVILLYGPSLDQAIIYEDITKAIIIFLFVAPLASKRTILWFSALVGLMFGVSETVLYAPQTTLTLVAMRFVLTVPMHMLTAFILGWFTSFNRFAILIGLPVAYIFHMFFDTIIGLV